MSSSDYQASNISLDEVDIQGDFVNILTDHKIIFKKSDDQASNISLDEVDIQGDFVNILTDHKIIFKKSQTPAVKELKLNALAEIKDKYATNFGCQISNMQLLKKINNRYESEGETEK
ncbi:hypothetical protein QE152_g30970 [Popillia japonica]|uniref:Uncharacterized protein n=1 Tax=Popillia japonica TaxID=7064 RepID=A0AAW1JE65_POPJA